MNTKFLQEYDVVTLNFKHRMIPFPYRNKRYQYKFPLEKSQLYATNHNYMRLIDYVPIRILHFGIGGNRYIDESFLNGNWKNYISKMPLDEIIPQKMLYIFNT